ncbi:MFS transporter [Roseomonas nepalensis]|uniref:MFS transporter n=1 Tax=Muricoccus nepalensis TaxID=1854500 RepID=A0A502G7Y5_9PROT|nr:MFS transporter [Roseomonas nepalensis]TPG57156.1 MFS transporter [Roseomonas nepalensis]
MRGSAPLIAAPGWRYAVIGGLYAYQGLVAGFAITALPNHYAAMGATTAAVGAHVATVGLPWILQPLWGPVVDRFGGFAMGRRRFWVVAALALSLLALARLLLVEDESVAGLPAVSAVFLVQSAFAALTDTATDGMIIDNVPAERLGTANAVTRVGFVCGAALGAALFAWMLPAQGLHASAAALLGIGTLALLLPLLVRERATDAVLSLRPAPAHAAGETFPRLLRRLAASFAGGATLILLVVCFATDYLGALFRLPLTVELIQNRGWEAEALSRFQAATALVTGTAGALLVGWWTDREGTSRALAILLSLCAASHLGAAALLLSADPRWAAMTGPLALGLSTVTPALLFVALAPAVMQASLGPAAATRFALFMASLNMGDVAGSAMAGQVAAAVGLPAVGLAAGGAFGVLALLSRLGVARRLGLS